MERRIRPVAFCSLLLATASCKQQGAGPADLRSDPVASTSTSTSASASAPAPDRAALEAVRAFLAPFAVSDDKPVQRVLYTWTTEAQIEELTKTKVLLSRSESAKLGPAAFDRELAARPATDAVAKLLRNPGFAKKRFAWSAPWATAFGLTGEPYGDRLVRIELTDDAIVGRFAATSGAWTFFDLQGNAVDEKVVLAHPERLAAVLHTSDDAGSGRPAYREYVVCNESRILEWSVATEAITKLLDDAADQIELLAKSPPVDAAIFRAGLPSAWRKVASDSVDAWSPTLAFATDDTVPVPLRLQKLAKRLRTVPRPAPPLVHRPARTFVLGSGVVPRPPSHPAGPVVW